MLEGWQRRVLAAAIPVVVVASTWSSLQSGGAGGPLYMAVAFSLLAALPRSLPVRLVIAAAMFAGATAVSAGSSAHRVSGVADKGLAEVSSVAPPFDAARHHELYVLVVIAATAFCLATAVTAGSRPFLAAALITVGIAWPATLMPSRNTIATGAFCLMVAMWPIVVAAAGDRRELARGAWALAGVTAVAIVLVGVGGAGRSAALDWQNWELFGESRAQRTVGMIWDANYGGVAFPREKTTVLRITAPHRARYWRATTLDLFSVYRWVEAVYTTDVSGGTRVLPRDGLLPAAAAAKEGWVKQQVDVRAVVDDHVVGASQPVQIAAGAGQRIQYQSSGVMRSVGGPAGMRRYTVWSYTPRPTPAELLRSPASYPRTLARYLEVGRATMPPFGIPGRSAAVSSIFRDERYHPQWPYVAVWSRARQVTDGAQSPYQATLRIERWLRTDGGFVYDERPPAPAAGVPPLVDFVQRTKLGYCQQFAGTMALMLRYLGIPARVAVGFTSGKWEHDAWTVTDHDAHAWVEAWFAGHGWLTFDPTPGRATLSAEYTNASDSADAFRALGSGRFLGVRSNASGEPSTAPVPPRDQPRAGRPTWPVALPIALLVGAFLGLAAVKRRRRLRRAATDDSRVLASAARADLIDFLRDQGSPLSPGTPVAELVEELRRLGVAGDGFAAAYTQARYGPPETAFVAAIEARLEAGRVLARLRDRVGVPRRVRGFLAFRSLRSD